ncbi:helix-turn-helix transcriptional regulator [Hirschia litorea]|uniref:Helix-turn-helix transcriptional regulator n=1 Tax=Hirschia litorea TaxID=1199156 RepID=A0ABW2ILP5_9PROT
MRRTERLFQIIQILRRNRRPVRGKELAEELGTSLRTIYRDIVELQAQRVPVEGEAGLGYVLSGDYDMPPLMLTADELEAAVLGARWVAMRSDPDLKRGAEDLLAKIALVMPDRLKSIVHESGVAPVQFSFVREDTCDVSIIRRAIREQKKLDLVYTNEKEETVSRVIWPFLVAYSESARFICAWCEKREDFRTFRTDRVDKLAIMETKFTQRVPVLRKQWKELQELRRKECVENYKPPNTPQHSREPSQPSRPN